MPAFVDGYQIGLYTAAAVMTAGAFVALVALRPEREQARRLDTALQSAS